jgi:hypothetical protein
VTDDAGQYRHVAREFPEHKTVAHSVDEYARYERNPDGSEYVIHTNTVEGYYSVFKRRNERRLPALRRKASAPLSERV